jgi:hypothetical protein
MMRKKGTANEVGLCADNTGNCRGITSHDGDRSTVTERGRENAVCVTEERRCEVGLFYSTLF